MLEKGIVVDLPPEEGVRVGGGRGGAAVSTDTIKSRPSWSGTSSGKAFFAQHVLTPIDGFLVRLHLRKAPEVRLERKKSLMLQRTLTEQSVAADDSYAKFKAQIKNEEAREFTVKLTVSLSRASSRRDRAEVSSLHRQLDGGRSRVRADRGAYWLVCATVADPGRKLKDGRSGRVSLRRCGPR